MDDETIRDIDAIVRIPFGTTEVSETDVGQTGALSQLETPEQKYGHHSPLVTLPPELLADIFLLTKDPLGHAKCRSMYLPLKSNLFTGFTNSCMHLSAVCRYWREVALNTPLLWSDITARLPQQRDYFDEMIRWSGRALLRLDLHMSYDHDSVNFFHAHLSRIETLYITVVAPIPSALPSVNSHYDTPHLRHLCLSGHGFPYDSVPPLVHHLSLDRLESLDINFLPYAKISSMFRPTLKHLTLQHCDRISSISVFLHALQQMPLLEELRLTSTFRNTVLMLPSDPPMVELPFLRTFTTYDNDALSSFHILRQTVLPSSVQIILEDPDYGAAWVRARLADTILSKAAGNGILRPAMPAHTLHVRSARSGHDIFPRVYLWNHDDAAISKESTKPRGVPSSPAILAYTPTDMYDSCTILQALCEAGPNHLSCIRTLIITHQVENHGNSHKISAPEYFWSDSLRCLTGVESLYLTGVELFGLGVSQITTLPNNTYTVPAGLPFPQLQLLVISHVHFHEPSTKGPQEPSSFVNRLRDMLRARKSAGIGITKLVLSKVEDLTDEDIRTLEGYVDNIDWDKSSKDAGHFEGTVEHYVGN